MDRSVGRRLAGWLQGEGHDVLEARTLGADPGDRALLELAASESRVLITIDTDFGELVYLHDPPPRWLGALARRTGGTTYCADGRGH